MNAAVSARAIRLALPLIRRVRTLTWPVGLSSVRTAGRTTTQSMLVHASSRSICSLSFTAPRRKVGAKMYRKKKRVESEWSSINQMAKDVMAIEMELNCCLFAVSKMYVCTTNGSCPFLRSRFGAMVKRSEVGLIKLT